jgi:Zn-dependent protease with chaperone function
MSHVSITLYVLDTIFQTKFFEWFGLLYNISPTLYSCRQAEFAADDFCKSVGMGPELASALDKIVSNMKDEKRNSGEALGIMKGAYACACVYNIDNSPSSERIAIDQLVVRIASDSFDDGRTCREAALERRR